MEKVRCFFEDLSWQFRVRFWYKIRYRFSRLQLQAMAGKIPMTRELFWNCLDICFCRHDRQAFWDLWSKYPNFVNEKLQELDQEMTDPNSQLRQDHDEWWSNLRPKLAAAFGDDWVRENCKE